MSNSFEQPSESLEHLLYTLTQALKNLPPAQYELGEGVTIEINDASLTIYEELTKKHTLIEDISTTGDYDVYIAGLGVITDEDIELLEKIEEERNIRFDWPELSAAKIKTALVYLEKIVIT